MAMFPFRFLLACFLGALLSNLWGDAPSIDAVRARLDSEIAAMDRERAEAREVLKRNYMGALARRGSELRNQNDQAGAAAILAELQRAQPLDDPRPDELSNQPDIRHFQSILQGQWEELDRQRADRLRAMVGSLQRYAEEMASTHRVSRRMNEAEAWSRWGRSLETEILEGLPPPADRPAAAVASTPGRPGTGPATGPSRFWTRLQAGERQHLVIYGTSLVTQRHTRLPTRLPQAVNRELGEDLLRVTERTNAGEYSKWGADNIRNQVIRSRPDAVILEFGSNDSVDRFEQTVEQARVNWETMVTTLKEELPDCDIFVYITAPPWDRDSSGHGAHGSRRPNIEAFFAMIREVAAKHQVFLIDTWHEFAERKDPPNHRQYRRYIGDGHHPSGQGVGEIIIPMMMQTFQHGSSDTLGRPGLHRR